MSKKFHENYWRNVPESSGNLYANGNIHLSIAEIRAFDARVALVEIRTRAGGVGVAG